MGLTRNNTETGNITTFAALGLGDWFDNADRGLCLKLASDTLKRDVDGGVESGIDPALECSIVDNDKVTAVAAPGTTFAALGDGAWFVDFTRGLCIKINTNTLKRKNDGAVETDVPGDIEVIAKSEAEITGSYNP